MGQEQTKEKKILQIVDQVGFVLYYNVLGISAGDYMLAFAIHTLKFPVHSWPI